MILLENIPQTPLNNKTVQNNLETLAYRSRGKNGKLFKNDRFNYLFNFFLKLLTASIGKPRPVPKDDVNVDEISKGTSLLLSI